MNARIEGVVFRKLKTHADERGFFRELIRVTDDFFSEGFGQWSHSLMFDGVIKAWHLHRIQTDWWYVVSGVLRVGLCDMRADDGFLDGRPAKGACHKDTARCGPWMQDCPGTGQPFLCDFARL